MVFLWCARQGALLGDERSLRARSGESRVDDKGVWGDPESEGSRYDKTLRRGTRSAYEAVCRGEMAIIIEAQN